MSANAELQLGRNQPVVVAQLCRTQLPSMQREPEANHVAASTRHALDGPHRERGVEGQPRRRAGCELEPEGLALSVPSLPAESQRYRVRNLLARVVVVLPRTR